jgi:hypothetical protein
VASCSSLLSLIRGRTVLTGLLTLGPSYGVPSFWCPLCCHALWAPILSGILVWSSADVWLNHSYVLPNR